MEEGGGFQQMISNIEFLTLEDDSDDRDMHKVSKNKTQRTKEVQQTVLDTLLLQKPQILSQTTRETVQELKSMNKKARKLLLESLMYNIL
jgi:hypothetical protein